MLKDITKAANAITTEIEDNGHTMDAIYSDYEADDLLSRLDLKVDE